MLTNVLKTFFSNFKSYVFVKVYESNVLKIEVFNFFKK